MPPQSRNVRQPARAAAAAFIGTMIEWYDFYIYATAAALVFGELYFPSGDRFVSTMASFATFAVGFFARPLGGVIFGHLGDRIGRKKALMTTLMMMGVATVCVGLLPDYATVGVLAPVLLVLLRVVQGIAVGGEWGGAVLMAGEHAPQGRRTFFASFAQLGSPAGLILSLVAFRAVTSMDKAAFLSWGWRLPFLASAVLLVVGILIRLGVNESPEFAQLREARRTAKLPIAEVLRSARALVLLGIGANTIGIAGVYFTNTFMIAYTTQYVGVTRSTILDCLFVVAILQLLSQPCAAWLAERIGGGRFLKLAALLAMLSPYPMFVLVQHGTTVSIVIGIALAVVCMAGFYSVIAGFISEIFPTRIRYSAISLAYQVCGAIAGGLTPLVGTWLAHRYTGQWWPLAVFYTGLATISLVCIAALDARRATQRDGAQEADPALSAAPAHDSTRTRIARRASPTRSGARMTPQVRIDGDRLWRSLMEMAGIGATARGGVRRLALDAADLRGRALFARWCREAGMTVATDAVGNLFARRAGADPQAPPVLVGSHLDTQPEGGRFDGVYGVLAGLELVRALDDAGIVTDKPIEIVSWSNEEGARFTPAMLGSAVFTGALPLDTALAARDADGTTLAGALDAGGCRGEHAVERVDAYFEAHIEQGPVLEANGNTIGVVTAGQAIRWLDVTVTGVAAHAGTTPMPYRRDALFASAQMALELERIVADHAPRALATIGQLSIPNASRNTIAGRLGFSVDLRHHEDAQVDTIEHAMRAAFERVAAGRGLRVEIDTHWRSPATPFDADCVALVRQGAEAFGYAHEPIVSGAGHDAILLARRCPTAMVFIPCVGGLSHNEAEHALPDDVSAGANVLLHAVLARAGHRASR